jgi:hypothetical protein
MVPETEAFPQAESRDCLDSSHRIWGQQKALDEILETAKQSHLSTCFVEVMRAKNIQVWVAEVSGRLTLKFHASICPLSPLAKKEKKYFHIKNMRF